MLWTVRHLRQRCRGWAGLINGSRVSRSLPDEFVNLWTPGFRSVLALGRLGIGAALHTDPPPRRHRPPHPIHLTPASPASLVAGSRGFAASASPRQQGPGTASSSSSSGTVHVDEAALQQLVQQSAEVTAQHGKSQWLAAEEIAARVRVLLAAGLPEADAAAVITAGKGALHFDPERAVETLRLLARLGLTDKQTTKCLRLQPTLLSSSTEQMAAVVRLVSVELQASNARLVTLICRAPSLLNFKLATVECKLAWWRSQGQAVSNWPSIRSSLRVHPSVLQLNESTIRGKLDKLQEKLGASRQGMVRKLPGAIHVLDLDLEGTILPRIDFLLDLLGEVVRRRILNLLVVLRIPEETVQRTLQMLAGLMGSEQVAVGMLARSLQLLTTGSTHMERNFDALHSLVGGKEAARNIADKNPVLLTKDVSQPATAHRIQFWLGQLGLSAADLLLEYGALPKSRLDRVGPRWAWIQQHKPNQPLTAKAIHCTDEACMQWYGVPLEGFAPFKKQWLASEEGRRVCVLESKAERSDGDEGAWRSGGEAESERK